MYCRKCGEEIKEEWRVCPNCGFSTEDGEKHIEADVLNKVEGKSSKKKKKKKKRLWLLVIPAVLIGFALLSGNDTSEEKQMSKTEIVSEAKKAEVKTFEEIGGLDGWEEAGYSGRVRVDIVVSLPVTPKDDENYAVQIQTSMGAIVIVTQEDDAPAKEWEWLMNAKPFLEGEETATFKATLIHCGGVLIDDEVIPKFIVTDVEPY